MRTPEGPDEDDHVAGSPTSPQPMLHVRLFGEFDLRIDDERHRPLASARARSLLAYLLVHDGAPLSRQRLAFLLWPDSTEGKARTNLRHALHTLRGAGPALDRTLDVTLQTLRWRREVAYSVDVLAFEAAVARAGEAAVASGEELAALRDAIELFAGDLLDGCSDEWLVEERERLRDRYSSALQPVAELLANLGEHGEGVPCWAGAVAVRSAARDHLPAADAHV